MANFTPEDVVRAYKEKGLRPGTNAANVHAKDGKWVEDRAGGRCCAMGALVLGQDVTVDINTESIAFANQLGVNFWEFSMGFDHDEPLDEDASDDRRLGRACREAVIAEFGEIPYYDA